MIGGGLFDSTKNWGHMCFRRLNTRAARLYLVESGVSSMNKCYFPKASAFELPFLPLTTISSGISWKKNMTPPPFIVAWPFIFTSISNRNWCRRGWRRVWVCAFLGGQGNGCLHRIHLILYQSRGMTHMRILTKPFYKGRFFMHYIWISCVRFCELCFESSSDR